MPHYDAPTPRFRSMLNTMTRTRFSILSAALAFAVTEPAFAQDAAAPIRRGSPTPEEHAPAVTSTPTPVPTATPTPTPESARPTPSAAPEQPRETPARAETTATPAPAKSSAPTRKTIDEPAVRAIERKPANSRRSAPEDEPAPPPVILPRTRPTFDLSDHGSGFIGATIRSLENRWQRAIIAHDFGTIEELVSDDFVGTSTTGRVGSKSTLLSEMRRDKNTYTSVTAHSMVVRSQGPSVAVATGVSREIGTTPDGRRFTNVRRFTDTWTLRDRKWQCVASSVTELPKR